MKIFREISLGVSALALSIAAPVHAASFVLNDVGGVAGTPAAQGFAMAAAYWSSVLADSVTIRLNIGFSSLNPGILGQAGSSSNVYGISAVYGALAGDVTSTLDATAVTNLSPLTGGAITAITSGGPFGDNPLAPVLDNDGSANNLYMSLNTATAKALGASYGGADADITFNSDFNFDFDPTDGITSGFYDFLGVAIHEIGHALGFTSGVDTYDYCSDGYCGVNLNNYAMAENLDIFRYSAPGVLNWNPGSEAYFSIDGGVSEFLGNANFSTGTYNGDGRQASHWKAPGTCSNFIGIMNPYLCDGQTAVVSAQDLGALDAIGWDLNIDALANPGYRVTTADIFRMFTQGSGVPEPSIWLQMIFGFGLVGAVLRRMRGKGKDPVTT